MLVTETTGIKLLPKIIVLNPKDGDEEPEETAGAEEENGQTSETTAPETEGQGEAAGEN